MKATGIVRRLNERGEICLPKELIRSMGIQDAPMVIYISDGRIILEKYDPTTYTGEDK